MSEAMEPMSAYFPAGDEGGSRTDSRKWAQQNIVGRQLKRAAAKTTAVSRKTKRAKAK
ncbi:MAG TPA: hypothetical protein VGS22_06235 [Thermoanaerobaculia bacterium]|jgi:hypothetical protein|nr:hypothetical protein [Thermoanaerobaculia bacterium]